MTVSIIIPVYNTKFDDLSACLDSIRNQTFRDFEVILVDDGSGEEYRKKLDTLTDYDTRISVLHKDNEGVSAARNFGIAHAAGKYILFVDGDDVLTPWLLESGTTAIEKYGCDVIIGKIRETNVRPLDFPERNGEPPIERIDSARQAEELRCHIFAKSCARWQRDDEGWEFNAEGCWAHLMRADIAHSFLFMPGVSIGEDTIWALSLADHASEIKIGMLFDNWYYYIQNDCSVLHQYRSELAEKLTAPVRILDNIYGRASGAVYEAYVWWVLVKLKQICFRAFLTKENTDSIFQKNRELTQLLCKEPWKNIITRKRKLPGKDVLKFKLYEKNLMLYLYAAAEWLSEKTRRKSLYEN